MHEIVVCTRSLCTRSWRCTRSWCRGGDSCSRSLFGRPSSIFLYKRTPASTIQCLKISRKPIQQFSRHSSSISISIMSFPNFRIFVLHVFVPALVFGASSEPVNPFRLEGRAVYCDCGYGTDSITVFRGSHEDVVVKMGVPVWIEFPQGVAEVEYSCSAPVDDSDSKQGSSKQGSTSATSKMSFSTPSKWWRVVVLPHHKAESSWIPWPHFCKINSGYLHFATFREEGTTSVEEVRTGG